MQKMKKFISILLALTLVFGTFAVSASAWTGAASEPIGFEVTADKTTVNPGDTVKITVKLRSSGAWTKVASGAVSFMYNNSLLTIDSMEFGEIMADWAMVKDPGNIVAGNALTNVKNKCTAEEKAAWDANGYNAICKLQFNKDANTTYGAQGYWEPEDGMVMAVVTATVSDSAAVGSTVNFDMVSGLAALKHTAFQTVNDAGKATYQYGTAYYDVTAGDVVMNVGSSTVELKFSDVKNQIRFDKTADGKYANTFDGRMVVSIDNLAEVVGADVNLASVQAKIKEIGFLYAKNGAINADTALAQIKGGAATYSVATGGGYISTGFDEADYAVTGIIHNIPDAEKATPISAAVYAIYDADGDGVDEYTVLVLNGGETFTFGDLYSRNFNTAFPA